MLAMPVTRSTRPQLLVVLALSALLVGILPPGVSHAQEDEDAYVELTPERLLDTRDAQGDIDEPLGAGSTRTQRVAGEGSIPPDAEAVAINVTAVNPAEASFLTVFPTGDPRPLAASVNFPAGRHVGNMIIAELGDGGQVEIYNDQGSVDVVMDVMGYFPDGADYEGLTPERILDTRDSAPLGPRTTRAVNVTGQAGVPEAGDVEAVAINMTSVSPSHDSFLTVFPGGTERPGVASLNFEADQNVGNLVISEVDDSGDVNLYNDAGSTHVAFDVVGFFPEGSEYEAVDPARALDTRNDVEGDIQESVGPGETVTTTVGGEAGIPDTARAVALNVTAVSPSDTSFLTVFPTGEEGSTAATVNFPAGLTTGNKVIVPLGEDGQVDIYNDRGQVDVTFDVVGFFPGLPGSISGEVSAEEGDAAVEGAEVTLFDDGDVEVGSDTTGADGVYGFEDVEPGEYTVEVEADGFELADESVSVDSREDVVLDVSLTLADGWVLNTDTGETFGQVQAGVDAASEGDGLVARGLFEESVVIGTPLSLASSTAGDATIAFEPGSSAGTATVLVETVGVTLADLDIERTAAGDRDDTADAFAQGVQLRAAGAAASVFDDLTVTGVGFEDGTNAGIMVRSDGGALENVEVTGNVVAGFASGVAVTESDASGTGTDGDVSDVEVSGNDADGYVSAVVIGNPDIPGDEPEAQVTDNTIAAENAEVVGLTLSHELDTLPADNTFEGDPDWTCVWQGSQGYADDLLAGNDYPDGAAVYEADAEDDVWCIGPEGTVSGLVADVSDAQAGDPRDGGAEPIEGATVTVLDGEDVVTTTQTGSDGTYEVDVAAGTYDVQATAEGYVEAFSWRVEDVEVEPGESVEEIDLGLYPEADEPDDAATTGSDASDVEIRGDGDWWVIDVLDDQRDPLGVEEDTEVVYVTPDGEAIELGPAETQDEAWFSRNQDGTSGRDEGDHLLYYNLGDEQDPEWWVLETTFDADGTLTAVNADPYPPDN